MKIELLNMIETVDNGVKKLRPLALEYIRNKDFSLEDRWEFFTKLPPYIFDTESYYATYTINDGEIVWYDDHYIDRHATGDNLRIVEKYEEKMDEDGFDYDPDITKESIDDLKEQMLQSGYRFWINDW